MPLALHIKLKEILFRLLMWLLKELLSEFDPDPEPEA